AAYTRWFPQGRSDRHRAHRSSHVDMLITDQAMTEIYRRAELLGMPTDQTLQFVINGQPRAVPGLNAPQVMRAWLLQAETGCRAPGVEPEYLFLRTWAKTCDQMPMSYGTYNNVLRALARTVPLLDENRREVGLGRTHRLRHTKATRLLEAGVPLPVVQRYLG